MIISNLFVLFTILPKSFFLGFLQTENQKNTIVNYDVEPGKFCDVTNFNAHLNNRFQLELKVSSWQLLFVLITNIYL